MPAHPRPHSSPAALMNPRGPSRSISHPSSGCTQVWHRMNSVKANWISDSVQPVSACKGWTNSVHAYWRLAIMIIAISDATSWNHRLLTFTQPPLWGGEQRRSCLTPAVQQLRAGIDGTRRRHRHAEPFTQFHDRTDNGFELHRASSLE